MISPWSCQLPFDFLDSIQVAAISVSLEKSSPSMKTGVQEANLYRQTHTKQMVQKVITETKIGPFTSSSYSSSSPSSSHMSVFSIKKSLHSDSSDTVAPFSSSSSYFQSSISSSSSSSSSSLSRISKAVKKSTGE